MQNLEYKNNFSKKDIIYHAFLFVKNIFFSFFENFDNDLIKCYGRQRSL